MTARWRPTIDVVAAKHGLDPDVVEALIERESGGRWFAYRYEPEFYRRYIQPKAEWHGRDPEEVAASYGLMQIMYTTAQEVGFTGAAWDLMRPDVNLEHGCRYLAKLLAKAKAQYHGVGSTVPLLAALAAYNGGPRGNEADDVPDRNRTYASSVLNMALRIKRTREASANDVGTDVPGGGAC